MNSSLLLSAGLPGDYFGSVSLVYLCVSLYGIVLDASTENISLGSVFSYEANAFSTQNRVAYLHRFSTIRQVDIDLLVLLIYRHGE